MVCLLLQQFGQSPEGEKCLGSYLQQRNKTAHVFKDANTKLFELYILCKDEENVFLFLNGKYFKHTTTIAIMLSLNHEGDGGC